MSFLPPPPPGMPTVPPGMPPPPPGMPLATQGDPSSSRLPPEVLSLKSQKWIQMQKKRYGQKRKGGFVDMGKQVRYNANSRCLSSSERWRFV
jgi:pre-mRNA-processing factor 8